MKSFVATEPPHEDAAMEAVTDTPMVPGDDSPAVELRRSIRERRLPTRLLQLFVIIES